MLAALRERFDVQVASEIFGSDIIQAIQSASLVINLHYYENALLETPRIWECLSLGTPVVSESSRDQYEYPEFENVVHFFEEGSIPSMISAIETALLHPVAPETIALAAERGRQRFQFFFDRFLIAQNFLASKVMNDLQIPIIETQRVALSLPETIARRRLFEGERPKDCIIFDGLRRIPGWIGCGLSYSALARWALRRNIKRLTVMEDDVLLPPDFDKTMDVIHRYLDVQEGRWDIFAGMIAVLHPNVNVLNVETYENIKFITIDKMTSMVCNIYSEQALRLLAEWNPDEQDVDRNTIDRYLERQSNLRVVTTLPYLVKHRGDMQSTLWGVKNSHYDEIISNSEQNLLIKSALMVE